MKKSLYVLAIGSLALSTYVNASANYYQEGPHFYVGGSYGLFKSRGGDFKDENDLWEINAGFFFNSFIGFEASSTWFGEYGGSLASADTNGYGIALVGRLPLSDSWAVYAKGGQFYWKSDVDTAIGSASFDGDDLFYALGTDVRLTDNLSMVIEYSRYEVDTRAEDLPGVENTDLDTLKAGVRLRF
jgi:hypothetical protein